MRPSTATALGLAAGYALDAALGDPRRYHPVAGFGRIAGALEKRWYAPDRATGVRFATTAVGAPVVIGILVTAATRHRPWLRAAAMAAGTWTVLGGASLRREGQRMAAALDANDLGAARARLSHLCGRDPSPLDGPELARATVESVAENTSDAVVAPLFWGATAGLPGLLGYRAVNTLDAMVGHRNQRYEQFGWASARLDDVANLLPSRLTGLLTIAAAPLAAGSAGRAARVWWRDRHRHPSPNSGQCEAAMAGALGVQLGGRNVYRGRIEDRPLLGEGPRPGPDAIRGATALSGLVGLAAAVLAVGWRLHRRG